MRAWFQQLREPVSGLTHGGAAVLAGAGLIPLVAVGWGDLARLTSLIVYGLSLVTLFAASAAYHLVQAAPEIIQRLRKLDHSAIYVLIAGTYTPFCVNVFTADWRWIVLAVIWALAGVGVAVKVFTLRSPRWLTAGLYLLMGWIGVIPLALDAGGFDLQTVAWLIAGGLAYSLGAIVYVTKRFDFWPGRFGFHEVWHLFVIAGAACHFVSVMVSV